MEKEIRLDDVYIMPGYWRNFAGAERTSNIDGRTKIVNNAGMRNFTIRLNQEQADWFTANGFTVNPLRPDPKDPQAPQTYRMKVNLSYRYKTPPYILQITKNSATNLTEGTVAGLDDAEIERADLLIYAREYEPGKHTAYCRQLFVTIKENPYKEKYHEAIAMAEAQGLPFN